MYSIHKSLTVTCRVTVEVFDPASTRVFRLPVWGRGRILEPSWVSCYIALGRMQRKIPSLNNASVGGCCHGNMFTEQLPSNARSFSWWLRSNITPCYIIICLKSFLFLFYLWEGCVAHCVKVSFVVDSFLDVHIIWKYLSHSSTFTTQVQDHCTLSRPLHHCSRQECLIIWCYIVQLFPKNMLSCANVLSRDKYMANR
jgi:hypothetical protein